MPNKGPWISEEGAVMDGNLESDNQSRAVAGTVVIRGCDCYGGKGWHYPPCPIPALLQAARERFQPSPERPLRESREAGASRGINRARKLLTGRNP